MRVIACFLLIIALVGCKKHDEVLPPADKAIVGWGDSLTEGSGGEGVTYLTALANLSGIPKTFNKGISGQKSGQIRERMLADTALHKYPTIIWAGTNNVGNDEQILDDIAQMVASLGHKHYIILPIMNGVTLEEEKGKKNYNHIMYVNNALAQIYGQHYVDVRSYLVSQYDPNNPQDVQNHADDIPPASLRSSKIHLTARGYTMVAEQIYQHRDALFGDK
jgi:lysophospholipase L1-like esterase